MDDWHPLPSSPSLSTNFPSLCPRPGSQVVNRSCLSTSPHVPGECAEMWKVFALLKRIGKVAPVVCTCNLSGAFTSRSGDVDDDWRHLLRPVVMAKVWYFSMNQDLIAQCGFFDNISDHKSSLRENFCVRTEQFWFRGLRSDLTSKVISRLLL